MTALLGRSRDWLLEDADADAVMRWGPDAVAWAPDERAAVVRASVLLAYRMPPVRVVGALAQFARLEGPRAAAAARSEAAAGLPTRERDVGLSGAP